jgi:hypothetical protein
MIKGATLIASNCLPQLRLKIAKGLQGRGFLVDGKMFKNRKYN